MAKKIWYSAPLAFYWKELYGTQKKITPRIPDEQMFHILRLNLIKAPLAASESVESRELMVSGLEVWEEDLQGELLHVFFLEQQLRDFLQETPLSDLDGIKKYLYENGKHKQVVYWKVQNRSDCVVYNYGIHIPYETNGYAFALSIAEGADVEVYFCQGSQHGRMSDRFYQDLKNKDDRESAVLCRMFRLAINTIAYMTCFPECVTEGVPRITVDRDEARSDRNVSLQVSAKIKDGQSPSPARRPHFRKGYFKLLKSSFYTNKQGELIYVTETMVKGSAKTVATSNKIERLGRRGT